MIEVTPGQEVVYPFAVCIVVCCEGIAKHLVAVQAESF
jgi:hypothetical protein